MIRYDSANSIIAIGEKIFINWCRRNGCDLSFRQFCGFEFCDGGVVHARGYYFHLGNYGGYISWKSSKCYEVLS